MRWIVDALADKRPTQGRRTHRGCCPDQICWAITAFPKQIWHQIWFRTTIRNDSTRRSAAASTLSESSPTANAPVHLVGALPAGNHDEMGRIPTLLSLDVLSNSSATNDSTTEQEATSVVLTA